MKNERMKKLLSTMMVLGMSAVGIAQNPFVQTWFTSDPAPMVHDGTMYVYTGHDEDKADFFWMQEWRVYSTRDMVNWQDHGSPLALESFSWADDRAWASQCVERDGKFYWYICAHSRLSNGMAIGVAVSDSPTGPFRDAIGKPLFENGSWDHIDPTVLIDDDGQAWLMWGNPQVYYLKLNRDMISYSGELGRLDMTEEAFGGPMMSKREKGKQYKDSYVEGPWLRKVQGSLTKVRATQGSMTKFKVQGSTYQLLYAAGGVPEHISYSTAPSPVGPWKYAGVIMPLSDTGSFTNHCGVADYKGHSYFFYHTGKLPGGGGFGRSVAVEEFQYNADGSFPTIMPTDEGVKPVDTFCPFRRVEAETMAFSRGVKTEQGDDIGVYVSDIHNGDYIKLQHVAFGNKLPAWRSDRNPSGQPRRSAPRHSPCAWYWWLAAVADADYRPDHHRPWHPRPLFRLQGTQGPEALQLRLVGDAWFGASQHAHRADQVYGRSVTPGRWRYPVPLYLARLFARRDSRPQRTLVGRFLYVRLAVVVHHRYGQLDCSWCSGFAEGLFMAYPRQWCLGNPDCQA